MKNRFILCVFLFVIALSCRQNENGAYKYTSLQIDTSRINIFNWDTSFYTFARFSEPMALTNDDIELADSLLIDAVNQFNKTSSEKFYEKFNKQVSIDSFRIDLSKYQRQYFPYEDNNGQRILRVVSFSNLFPEWRSRIYNGRSNGGISNFYLRINLSDRKLKEFFIGGYGG